VGVCSIYGQTTTEEEISNDTMKCITEKINLILNKLVGICTDGVPSTDRKSTVLFPVWVIITQITKCYNITYWY